MTIDYNASLSKAIRSLDFNQLPVGFGEFLKDICKAIFEQSKQIEDLLKFKEENSNELSKIQSEMNLSKDKLQNVTDDIDKLTLNIDENYKKVEKLVNNKYEEIERNLEVVNKSISNNDQTAFEIISDMERRWQDNTSSLRAELNDLKEVSKYQSSLEMDDLQLKYVDGSVDISPLLRCLYRDSRRIDGFDELISQNKRDCAAVMESILKIQEYLTQFNHNFHDFSITDGKIISKLHSDGHFFHESMTNNDSFVEELYTICGKISEAMVRFVFVSTESFELIETILGRMTTRVLPPFPTLRDSQNETTSIRDEIRDKKALYNDGRRKFQNPPEPLIPPKVFKDAKVDVIEGRNMLKKDKIEFLSAEIGNYSRTKDEQLVDAIHKLGYSHADMKSKIFELENKIEYFSNETLMTDRTMDTQTTERLFSKFESLLEKLNKRVSNLENTPRTHHVTDNIKKPFEVGGAIVTKGIQREYPRSALARNKPALTNTLNSPRKSRLASDRISDPFK